jgi:hypothetical protein
VNSVGYGIIIAVILAVKTVKYASTFSAANYPYTDFVKKFSAHIERRLLKGENHCSIRKGIFHI